MNAWIYTKESAGLLLTLPESTCLYHFIQQAHWVHLKYNLVCTWFSHNLSLIENEELWSITKTSTKFSPTHFLPCTLRSTNWSSKGCIIWLLLQSDRWSPEGPWLLPYKDVSPCVKGALWYTHSRVYLYVKFLHLGNSKRLGTILLIPSLPKSAFLIFPIVCTLLQSLFNAKTFWAWLKIQSRDSTPSHGQFAPIAFGKVRFAAASRYHMRVFAMNEMLSQWW